MESLKSSFTAQQAQSLTDAIQEVINNAMMSARTMLPCEIAENGKDKGGIYWYKVQPLLNRQTTSGKCIRCHYRYSLTCIAHSIG